MENSGFALPRKGVAKLFWSGKMKTRNVSLALVNSPLIDFNTLGTGRSQNTVPIASTQVAIKGIVQYSTRTDRQMDRQSSS